MKYRAIVQIRAGLGNQLFIYAFARLMSLKYSIDTLLEVRSGFQRDGYKRKYRLNQFSIKLKEVSFLYSFFIIINKRGTILKNIFFPNTSLHVEDESKKIKELDISDLPSKKHPVIYYQGYWQYMDFSSIREILLKELNFKLKPDERFCNLLRNIQSSNAISVHIRRVQYEGSVISFEYYEKAFLYIRERIENSHFFIFSDDIGWCKKNIEITSHCTFVDNFDDELSELKLMSLCNHSIIANSTFSWWGAWLNLNTDKIVVMPKGYLTNSMNGEIVQL